MKAAAVLDVALGITQGFERTYALGSIDSLISDREVDTTKEFDYDLLAPMKGVLRGAAKRALDEFVEGMSDQLGIFDEDEDDEEGEVNFMPRIALAAFVSPSSCIGRIPTGSIMGSLMSGVGNKVYTGMSRKQPHHDVVLPRDDAYTSARSSGLTTGQAGMLKMINSLTEATDDKKVKRLAEVMVSKHGDELRRIGKLWAVNKILQDGMGTFAMKYIKEWVGEQTEARTYTQSEMWSRWVSTYKARSEDMNITDYHRYDFLFRHVGMAAWVIHVGKEPGRMWAATLIAMASACATLEARTGLNTKLNIEDVVQNCSNMFSSHDAGARRMKELVQKSNWRGFRQQEVVAAAIATAIQKTWRFFVCDILKPTADRERHVTGVEISQDLLNLDDYCAPVVMNDEALVAQHAVVVDNDEGYQEWLEENGIMVDDDEARERYEEEKAFEVIADVV